MLMDKSYENSSGEYNKNNYIPSLRANSKLLNRIQIIDFIIKNYENKIFFLKKYDDLKDIDYSNKPIVLSINDKLIKKTKTNLTHNQHLEIISKMPKTIFIKQLF